MKASEYVARIADKQPIEAVREELGLLYKSSPAVKKMGYDKLIGNFWEQISRRYAK